jgi:hypothetical protein
MRWSSSVGSIIGVLLAGPAGALTGHLVGGLTGELIKQHLDAIPPVPTNAIELTIGEEAGKRLKELGREVLEGTDAETRREVSGTLQAAFRDALIEAVYDVGGQRCFPSEWNVVRGREPAHDSYANTAEGQGLWMCIFIFRMRRRSLCPPHFTSRS